MAFLFLNFKDTNFNIANIIIMLLAIIITYFLLIFPIFITGDLIINKNKNEISYTIKIFWVIKLLYGYFELDKEGIIIHLNKKKAILIRYDSLLSVRKKFKPLKDYHLLKFNSTLDFGARENYLSIQTATFYSLMGQILGDNLKIFKPYFETNNTINIYEDSNELNFRCNAELVFNLLMVIISVIKIIVEKIIYAIKSRTQQN